MPSFERVPCANQLQRLLISTMDHGREDGMRATKVMWVVDMVQLRT